MSARMHRWFLPVLLLLSVLYAKGSIFGQERTQDDRHKLGEDLLLAAEHRDWKHAQELLEQGADPNLTAIALKEPTFDDHGQVIYAIEHAGALSQAAEQGNCEAVKLLLRFHANIEVRSVEHDGALMSALEAGQIETARLLLKAGADWSDRRHDGNHNALAVARRSGKRDLICLLEDTAKVPLYERTIPQDPFSPGAENAKPVVVAGTVGAYPLAHLLWVSPHELLILRQNPSQFVLLNLATKEETSLPELSRRWIGQKQFDPDMLAISPDGKWLVGFGGTSEKPTWIASEVRGTGWQECQRGLSGSNIQRGRRASSVDRLDRWPAAG